MEPRLYMQPKHNAHILDGFDELFQALVIHVVRHTNTVI